MTRLVKDIEQEARAKERERCAKIVEDECARVLAFQTGKAGDINESIDLNLRLTAVLLPDLARKIRDEIP